MSQQLGRIPSALDQFGPMAGKKWQLRQFP